MIALLAERLYTALLNTYAHRRKHKSTIQQKVLHWLRALLLRISDPIVTTCIHDVPLKVRLSHPNPLYAAVAPFYDTALPRLCRALGTTEGFMRLIDVGANVGDTVLAVERASGHTYQGEYLCVEPNDDNVQLLRINTASLGDRLICEQVLCGDENGVILGELVGNLGNSFVKVAHHNPQQALPVLTVDELVVRHSRFAKTTVLKIDTEGFDLKVLRGAQHLLSEAKPALYFEFIPSLLETNGENPLLVLPLLSSFGYDTALVYDNKGIPVEVISTTDETALQRLIACIDDSTVYYYDIFSMHGSRSALFTELIEQEFQTVHAA
jgi:FkbM family methyltransferase